MSTKFNEKNKIQLDLTNASHPIREFAIHIIDLIEHYIRKSHPEIEEIAKKYVTDENTKPNTLLYGDVYYCLEDKITDETAKFLVKISKSQFDNI